MRPTDRTPPLTPLENFRLTGPDSGSPPHSRLGASVLSVRVIAVLLGGGSGLLALGLLLLKVLSSAPAHAHATDGPSFGTFFGLLTPLIYAGIALLIGVLGAAVDSLLAHWTGAGEIDSE